MVQDEDATTAPRPDRAPLELDDVAASRAVVTKSFEARRSGIKAGPWNSLEVAKIIVGAMTPLLIAALGVYFTWESHRQDALRLAHDDLRSRKAAALPLVLDLERVNRQFIRESDDLRFRISADLASTKPRTETGVAFLGEFQKATSMRDRQVAEAWVKLEPLIDDPAIYAQLRTIYVDRIERPYLQPLDTCTTTSILMAYGGSGASYDPVRLCMSGDKLDEFQRCVTYLTQRLRNFDRAAPSPVDDAAAGCPAQVPVRAARAASR